MHSSVLGCSLCDYQMKFVNMLLKIFSLLIDFFCYLVLLLTERCIKISHYECNLVYSLHSSVDFSIYALKLYYLEHPNLKLLQNSGESNMLLSSLVIFFALKPIFYKLIQLYQLSFGENLPDISFFHPFNSNLALSSPLLFKYYTTL